MHKDTKTRKSTANGFLELADHREGTHGDDGELSWRETVAQPTPVEQDPTSRSRGYATMRQSGGREQLSGGAEAVVNFFVDG